MTEIPFRWRCIESNEDSRPTGIIIDQRVTLLDACRSEFIRRAVEVFTASYVAARRRHDPDWWPSIEQSYRLDDDALTHADESWAILMKEITR